MVELSTRSEAIKGEMKLSTNVVNLKPEQSCGLPGSGQALAEAMSVGETSIQTIMARLLAYCQERNWSGFDPYDALNSRLLDHTPFIKSRVFRIAVTQMLKRLPVNIRPLLFISKEQNPKAIGLFLMGLLKLNRAGLVKDGCLTEEMIRRLVALRSPNTPFWCWGYSFPWQTRTVLVPRWAPNIVCTTFVANALLDAYEELHQPEHLRMAVSAGEYVLSTLYWTDGDGIASFSYPLPGLRSRVHNANFLTAAFLCRLYKHIREAEFLDAALRTARYSAKQQHNDGSWAYGEQTSQQWVDNFHTGYNLCALRTISLCTETDEFEACLARGFEFYRSELFTEEGVPKYFHNSVYPIDIHSVAQSLITFITLRDLDRAANAQVSAVWNWAVRHMWDREGYFYYRVHRFGTVKVPYMRWSQAWMFLAMAAILEHDSGHITNVSGAE